MCRFTSFTSDLPSSFHSGVVSFRWQFHFCLASSHCLCFTSCFRREASSNGRNYTSPNCICCWMWIELRFSWIHVKTSWWNKHYWNKLHLSNCLCALVTIQHVNIQHVNLNWSLTLEFESHFHCSKIKELDCQSRRKFSREKLYKNFIWVQPSYCISCRHVTWYDFNHKHQLNLKLNNNKTESIEWETQAYQSLLCICNTSFSSATPDKASSISRDAM